MTAVQEGFAGFMREYKDRQKTKAKKVQSFDLNYHMQT